jgi:hypothetical protein
MLFLTAFLLLAPVTDIRGQAQPFAVYEGGAFGTLDAPGHVIALPMRDAPAGSEVKVCLPGGRCTYAIVTAVTVPGVGAVGRGVRLMLLGVETELYPTLDLLVFDGPLPDMFWVVAEPKG